MNLQSDYLCDCCQIFKENDIDFRNDNTLQQTFEDFVNKEFVANLPKKKMKPNEQKFRQICQNLKLHLGSKVIETDLFKGMKSVIQRDYEEDLNSGKAKIFVPNVYIPKFAHVLDNDQLVISEY